jgi:uncharacterized protein with GYD domain
MATYVSLIRFTEQGARNIQDTQKRAGAFREAAKKAGATVREQFWTMGTYDGVLVLDAPDEQTATAVMAGLGALGNVRTQTMRAFDESEIGQVLGGGSRSGGGSGGGTSGGGRSKR